MRRIYCTLRHFVDFCGDWPQTQVPYRDISEAAINAMIFRLAEDPYAASSVIIDASR